MPLIRIPFLSGGGSIWFKALPPTIVKLLIAVNWRLLHIYLCSVLYSTLCLSLSKSKISMNWHRNIPKIVPCCLEIETREHQTGSCRYYNEGWHRDRYVSPNIGALLTKYPFGICMMGYQITQTHVRIPISGSSKPDQRNIKIKFRPLVHFPFCIFDLSLNLKSKKGDFSIFLLD